MTSQDDLARDEKNAHLSPTVRARLQQCYNFGNQKMQAGEHDYANEMFSQCVLGNPGNLIYLQSFVANLRLKYGNNKKGAALGKFKGGTQKTAIKVAESRSNWEAVLKAGVELLAINPWNASVFFSMGKAALALGYDETGLALLKHAVDSNPNDVEINRYAAQELGSKEKFEDAIACLQRIINVKPDDRDASRLMGDMMLQRTIKKIEVKKEEKDKEKAEISATPTLNAEDVFEKRIRKTPEDRDLWIEYGEYFSQQGNYRKTEDTYRRAVKSLPNDPDLFLRLCEVQKIRAKAELLRFKEQYDKAPSDDLKEKFLQQRKVYDEKNIALIRQRLKMNPNGTLVRYDYGLYLMEHGQFKEAIVELQAAQQDESLKAGCYLAIAQCFQQIKQYKLALVHYEKAITVINQETDAESFKKSLYLAARLAAGLGDYVKAEQFASRLAAIDFSYKDVGDLLDKIAKKLQNNG